MLISGVLTLAFSYGLYSGSRENAVFKFILDIKKQVNLVLNESPNAFRPIHFLQTARYNGSGVTVNRNNNSKKDFILLVGFFDNNNELRLISRDGTIINRWPVKFSEIFPNPDHIKKPPASDWNIDLHGAVALADGSIVFNFEYGGIVKLDRCGNVVWKIPVISHHSVELAEDGSFWVPGRINHEKGKASPYPPFVLPYTEDVIYKISNDGKIISSIPVAELFYKNKLESLLTSNGEAITQNKQWDRELNHLNKVTELKSNIAKDFPLFSAGDLLLSLRTYNILLVLDPKTHRIKWYKIGPWKRQHDPEFKAGGYISVFNNNTYLTSYSNGKINLDSVKGSNIIEIDPVTNQYHISYGDKPGQNLLSIIRGKHELTSAGGILMTEFEAGRAFETDSNGNIVWEYINRYDKDNVAELTEALIYPANYFNITNWSCKTDKTTGLEK